MSDMVTRVANVIAGRVSLTLGSGTMSWEDVARAAIEAMREPTEAMCEAGDKAEYFSSEGINLSRIIDDDGIAIVYRAMIDAALK